MRYANLGRKLQLGYGVFTNPILLVLALFLVLEKTAGIEGEDENEVRRKRTSRVSNR
jgi:hypothetical protein